MKYRPVDEKGDMMPIQNDSQMLTGTDAVAAAVKSRLDLHRGDWWEDPSMGLEIPLFLANGLRTEKGCETLLGYIVAYIRRTQGVGDLEYSGYVRTKHGFVANVAVKTIYGDKVERSVDLSELLRALP